MKNGGSESILLPASQKALTLMGWVGYHDFEGGFIQPGREWPTLVRQLERLDGTDYRR